MFTTCPPWPALGDLRLKEWHILIQAKTARFHFDNIIVAGRDDVVLAHLKIAWCRCLYASCGLKSGHLPAGKVCIV